MTRGDNFFYLEVWNKSELRDSRISDILDEKVSETYYVNGSLRILSRVNRIEFALFWKNKSSAEDRIKSLKSARPNDKYTYIIKSLNRQEFIDIIPDKISKDTKEYHKNYWMANKNLKNKEIEYLKKIDNPWRYHKVKDLNKIFE